MAFISSIDQPLDAGWPWKKVDLQWGSILQLKQTPKSVDSQGLPVHSQKLRKKSLPEEGSGKPRTVSMTLFVLSINERHSYQGFYFQFQLSKHCASPNLVGRQPLYCGSKGTTGSLLPPPPMLFLYHPAKNMWSFNTLQRDGLSSASWRNFFVHTNCLQRLLNNCYLSIIQEYRNWPAEN